MLNSELRPRLIFFRSGAIGDIIHCLPFIKLVSERFAGARIDFIIANKQLKDLLELRAPYISNIYFSSSKDISGSKEFLDSLKQHPVDKFIYLHSTFLKGLWWNFKYIKSKEFYTYKKDLSFNAQANFALTLFPELKSQLRLDPYKVLDYRVLEGLGFSGGSEPKAQPPYISIVPGVGSLRPHRAFPLERWMDFIVELINDTNLNIKLLGGPDEINISRILDIELKKRVGDLEFSKRIENLIGKTSLIEVAEILENSSHLYSCDTGMLHIGAALGVSISSIFSVTSELRTGPFNPEAIVLRPKSCICCSKTKNRGNEKKYCSYLEKFDSGFYPKCTKDLILNIPINL